MTFTDFPVLELETFIEMNFKYIFIKTSKIIHNEETEELNSNVGDFNRYKAVYVFHHLGNMNILQRKE